MNQLCSIAIHGPHTPFIAIQILAVKLLTSSLGRWPPRRKELLATFLFPALPPGFRTGPPPPSPSPPPPRCNPAPVGQTRHGRLTRTQSRTHSHGPSAGRPGADPGPSLAGVRLTRRLRLPSPRSPTHYMDTPPHTAPALPLAYHTHARARPGPAINGPPGQPLPPPHEALLALRLAYSESGPVGPRTYCPLACSLRYPRLANQDSWRRHATLGSGSLTANQKTDPGGPRTCRPLTLYTL